MESTKWSKRFYTTLKVAFESQTPVILTGDPGSGKTAFTERIPEDNGWAMVKIVASGMDTSDIQGLPFAVEYTTPSGNHTEMVTEFLNLKWVHQVNDLAEEFGKCILFVDELSTAQLPVQNIFLTLFQSRHLPSGLKLHDNVCIVAAMNKAGTGVLGVNTINAALANRMIHLEFDPPYQEWTMNVVDNWGKCTDPEELHVRSEIAEFIEQNPGDLTIDLMDPKNAKLIQGAYPSRRSWDKLAKPLSLLDQNDPDTRSVELMLTSGLIGEAHGRKFLAWRHDYSMPRVEDVIAKPNSVNWGTDAARHFVILRNVIDAYSSTDKKDDITKVMEYMVGSKSIGTDTVCSLVNRAIKKGDGIPPKGMMKIKGLQSFFEATGLRESDDDLDG